MRVDEKLDSDALSYLVLRSDSGLQSLVGKDVSVQAIQKAEHGREV